jgi:nitrogen-specific signal transduction histidine kinase
MKTPATSVLYSQDELLITRIMRLASDRCPISPLRTPTDLDHYFIQFEETILLADIRARGCLEILEEIKKTHPVTVLIIIGTPRSDPMLEAEWINPFATLPQEPERKSFQQLMRQAAECLNLRQKNEMLEQTLSSLHQGQSRPDARNTGPRSLFSTPLQNFSKAQKNFDNINMLFQSVVEGLVATAKVSRAGIFTQKGENEPYRFQAGLRCLKGTDELTIPESHPFVRWQEMHTHLISRQNLDTIYLPDERLMLQQILNALGAEIIIPLYAKGQIKGWIFVGQRATGIPFSYSDLEDLSALSDHISTTLEKALQYEETVLQKALAETLLHSIPSGIIACDESGIIRWFNSSARDILQVEGDKIIGGRAEVLGSRIAHLLRQTLADREIRQATEWEESITKRTLAAQTRRLIDRGTSVGALLMLRDVTNDKLLQEKEDQLERAAFWNELAANISHEIRNPLVAIKTFSQLLPERYDDPEFRADFSHQVTQEVDQLNRMIMKINEFAYPPEPVFKPLDVRLCVQNAMEKVKVDLHPDHLTMTLSTDASHLYINGDESTFTLCIYHLLRNSAENLTKNPNGKINVYLQNRTSQTQPTDQVILTVTDNGTGIAPELKDKIFSPFCSNKEHAMGLGLPIVKRTVMEHNGQLNLETGSGGTCITITLPAGKRVPEELPIPPRTIPTAIPEGATFKRTDAPVPLSDRRSTRKDLAPWNKKGHRNQ